MDLSVFGILWALIGRAYLLLVLFVLIFHIKFFKRMLDNKMNLTDQAVLAAVFGIPSIYSTYSGVQTTGVGPYNPSILESTISNLPNASSITASVSAMLVYMREPASVISPLAM